MKELVITKTVMAGVGPTAARVWLWLLLVSGLPLLLHCLVPEADVPVQEYCSTEEFKAECADDEVIFITKARYGRMRLGRCVKVDFGFIGCSADMVAILDRKCSGRRRCQIRIPDAEMDKAQPCIGDLTPYLEASYECIKLADYAPHTCVTKGEAALSPDTGYIARAMASPDRGGTSACPFRISVPEGQRINLTLYDFTMGGRSLGGAAGTVCQRYATVREFDGRGDIDICSSADRTSHAYTSLGNSIEIRILENLPENAAFFLLHYEALGCARPTLDEAMEIMNPDSHRAELVIRCPVTGVIWRLECRRNKWVGPLGNCTEPPADVLPEKMNETEFIGYISSLPDEFIIIIVVSIAGIVGLCVVITGLVLFKKKRRRQPPRAPAQSCAIYGDVSVSMRKGHAGDQHGHYHTYVHKDSRLLSGGGGKLEPPEPASSCEDYIYSRQISPQSAESDIPAPPPPPPSVQYAIHSPNLMCKSHWQQTLGPRGIRCSCDKHSCKQPDVTFKSFNQDPLMYFELEPGAADANHYSLKKQLADEKERVDDEAKSLDSSLKSL